MRIEYNCVECGKFISRNLSLKDIKRGRGRFCSVICVRRFAGKVVRGPTHYKWKGGQKHWDEVIKKRNKENPQIRYAQHQTTYAIKTGVLIKQPCERCGNKAQAHHEDYSKPLLVKWLCPKHHYQADLKLGVRGWRISARL